MEPPRSIAHHSGTAVRSGSKDLILVPANPREQRVRPQAAGPLYQHPHNKPGLPSPLPCPSLTRASWTRSLGPTPETLPDPPPPQRCRRTDAEPPALGSRAPASPATRPGNLPPPPGKLPPRAPAWPRAARRGHKGPPRTATTPSMTMAWPSCSTNVRTAGATASPQAGSRAGNCHTRAPAPSAAGSSTGCHSVSVGPRCGAAAAARCGRGASVTTRTNELYCTTQRMVAALPSPVATRSPARSEPTCGGGREVDRCAAGLPQICQGSPCAAAPVAGCRPPSEPGIPGQSTRPARCCRRPRSRSRWPGTRSTRARP